MIQRGSGVGAAADLSLRIGRGQRIGDGRVLRRREPPPILTPDEHVHRWFAEPAVLRGAADLGHHDSWCGPNGLHQLEL